MLEFLMKTIQQSSPKTTVLGAGGVIAFIGETLHAAFDDNPATVPDYGTCLIIVMYGLALIFARDNNKSSESVGAKTADDGGAK